MEKEILKEWMERFFLAELTVDEERELYQYLCANEVPAELRKDREVILALCSTAEEDIELPEGAAERLEAMLDGLEKMKEESLRASLVTPPPYGHPLYKQRGSEGGLEAPPRRRTLLHREGWGGSFLLRAACVAGVAIALFVMLPDRVTEPLLTGVYEEEDTFDNPEEAMQCLMAAYGDIQYAMNATQRHTHEAYQTLEQSQSIIREMFNMNIN
jgi:hypothetical protein